MVGSKMDRSYYKLIKKKKSKNHNAHGGFEP